MNYPMNFKLTFFGSLLIGLMVTSCAKQVPYNKVLLADRGLEYWQLEKTFFYLSHEITLEREDTGNSDPVIENGKITSSSRATTERVVFPKETKGVLVHYSDNGDTLKVRFEQGPDNRHLTFVRQHNISNSRDSLTGNFYLYDVDAKKGTGTVIYHGDKFDARVTPDDLFSQACIIKVKLREFKSNRVNTRVVGGATLD